MNLLRQRLSTKSHFEVNRTLVTTFFAPNSLTADQAASLRDCMDLFCHRVDFQASQVFDAVVTEFTEQSDKLEPNLARSMLDCKALLEADIGGWTDVFGKSLRTRVDRLIDVRSLDMLTEVAPPTSSKLSLVDEGDVDIDVSSRVYAGRLAERASENLAKFSNRLASLLKVVEIETANNPFSTSVVAHATADAMTHSLKNANLVTLALRTLSRLLPLDLAPIYGDLDQFLQQRGVTSGVNQSRKVERAARPERGGGAEKARQKIDDLMNDATLSEQVATALLARVAAMNPQLAGLSAFGGAGGAQPGLGYFAAQAGQAYQGGAGSGQQAFPGQGGQPGFPGGNQQTHSGQGGQPSFPGGSQQAYPVQSGQPSFPGGASSQNYAGQGGQPGFASSGQVGGYQTSAHGGNPGQSAGMMGSGQGQGGFPQIVAPPLPPTGFGGQANAAYANSPQIAAMALLGAPMPAGMGGGIGVMQAAAPQLLHGIGAAQRDVVSAVQELAIPALAGAMGGVGAPISYSTEPLRALASSPNFASNASVLDFTTIELVAMVFDFVFKDDGLQDAMKGVITHLQIPLLKAALIDRNFFASRTHPGRVLLNRLAEVGRTWSQTDGANDPIYTTIREIVNDIARDFETDLEVFNKGAAKLDILVTSIGEEAAPVEIKAAEITEVEDRASAADAWARRAIRERLARAPLPQFVVNFLSESWLAYVRKLTTDNGEHSEPVQRSLDHADLLVESIKESLEPDVRRKMISRLPKLLADLKAGCTAVDTPADDRVAFFDKMFELHARLFKGLTVELPASPKGQPEKVPQAQIDIDLSNAPDDMFREIAMAMERGMWIEMQDDVGKLKLAKLSWISPQRTTYLFTTRQGHKAASLTPVQLAEWFREDRARVLDSEPVVDRALNSLLSDLVVAPG